MSSPAVVPFVCAALAVFGPVSAVPSEQRQQPQQPQQQPQQQQQQQQREDGGGFGAALWSVLDDCLDDASGSTAVCLKSKALTALDRALAKPTVVLAEGVALSARAGKSMSAAVDAQAEKAALDAAASDPDRKNALLDDMLASRMDRLVSTRTIVLDGLAGQEGRGKKKEKAMKQAMMMAGMMAAAVMGPMALKIIALMAGKALLISKIALVLSGIIALKKLFQSQKSGGGGHESESESHHYGRSMKLDAHDMAYSSQKQ